MFTLKSNTVKFLLCLYPPGAAVISYACAWCVAAHHSRFFQGALEDELRGGRSRTGKSSRSRTEVLSVSFCAFQLALKRRDARYDYVIVHLGPKAALGDASHLALPDLKSSTCAAQRGRSHIQHVRPSYKASDFVGYCWTLKKCRTVEKKREKSLNSVCANLC